MKTTPQAALRSKKKNKVTTAPTPPPQSVSSCGESHREPPPPQPDYGDEFVPPEPPPEYDNTSGQMPIGAAATQGATIAPVQSRRASKAGSVKSADEGEFWHKKATAESGLELQGKFVRYLRKSGDPAAARIFRLIARGVLIKERSEYIAFIAPDEVFLQLGEQSVLSELDSALDAIGEKKRAHIERTADELYHMDIERARELFTFDGVVPDKKR